MDDLTDFYRVYNNLMAAGSKYESEGNYEWALGRYEDAINLCKSCNMQSDDAESKYFHCLKLRELDKGMQ